MPKRELAPWQILALTQNYEHFCLYGGVGTGKSFTGAEFAIDRLRERPDLRGFIGANTHDQLAQVALREFYNRLTAYRIPYIINQIPPVAWQPRLFESYDRITTVRIGKKATNIFTRVLSKGDNLRGLEFGWYWIDETRDTPEYTHDVILGRMRQDRDYRRGLITTTTNGKDWTHRRFIKGAKRGLYGSAHVATYDAVTWGIVSQGFVDAMLNSYSPLMVQQEIEAKHVNVWGGRAYHAHHDDCRRRTAPWGDRVPDPERPLIVGCDFNFSPSPCVWEVGQRGPGDEWENHIHWFGEISMNEAATESMTLALVMRYPDFYYQVFGDASGNKGTTSNAGEVDYAKMAGVFEEEGSLYAIDSDQANPRVKDRVEAVNSMLTNGLGKHRMTYDPDACPLLDQDFEHVGWSTGLKPKLEGENEQHTHGSDAVGYAIYKLFGPYSVVEFDENVPSADR